MSSLILRTATRFMLPLLLVFAVFLMVRGHNAPGGGFSAGLVVSAAFSLYALAFGVSEVRRVLWIEPRSLLGVGLLVALASGLVGLLQGHPFLTHRYAWLDLTLANAKTHLGTALVFDLGVLLVVIGAALTVILQLAEE